MQSGIRDAANSSKSGPSGDFYNMARYQSISDLISNFVWTFHKALSETHLGNFAYSPVTVSSCVFSILQGADGVTRDELSQIIVTGGNDDHFTEEFSRINQLLKKFGIGSDNNNNELYKTELGVARFETNQRLFYSIGDSILDEYTKLLNTDFGIDTQAVDFTANSNTFRKINMWLESSCGIKRNASELKGALKLDALNRLMFISSMKFSGTLDLDLQYSEQEAFFQVNNSCRVSVKMLCAEQEISYAVFPQIDARAVSIPYKGDRCSLLIFLPKGKGGLNQLEHCLRSYKTLAQVMNTFQTKRKLQFRMPYFKIEQTININEALKLLGASSVFDTNYADFGRLEEMSENIFISGVIQSVQVDIHSQWNEPSPGLDLKSKKDDDSLEFHVEHPFFFMVYDQVSKTILVADTAPELTQNSRVTVSTENSLETRGVIFYRCDTSIVSKNSSLTLHQNLKYLLELDVGAELLISQRQSENCYEEMACELKNNAAVQAVAEGNSQLTATLHAVLKKENPGNLIFSPFSLSAVVAMAHLGARGSTAAEIASAFNFPEDNEVLTKGYSQVLASLQETADGYTLAAANRLYSQIGFALKKEFSDSIQSAFGAEVQQLDFSNNAASAAEINNWVEKITNNKIKELISADALNSLTRVVLVNGVYFKGQWKNKFDEEHTEKQPFHLNENDTVEVDMMYKQAKFPYAYFEDLDAHAVSLPYKGDRLSMVIYAPQQINGLSKIEDGLKDLSPSKVLQQFGSRSDVQVYLPRFKVESTLFLVEPLKALGAKSMFGDGADFGGIPETDEGLFVSEVVQKAFIEVNEEGSEAAAATGMVMMMRCLPITHEFRADRPFYFQIVDHNTNFVLFAGSCKNPAT
ncbi:unnamed protein product [Allacma fusca]|uniref:Serpin domain-containing protein n=1 Tax=Allacma fusca TaxID=39272 RepID=A0A8J2PFG6_9HEXA|nr:unnamed protein product [Allacma fusca]